MNRRRFLKYAGATAAVVGASAVGLDYLLKPETSNLHQVTATTTSKFNSPPMAQFDYKPKYLDPTDQETIQFKNLSTDPDGDPLTYRWLVDNRAASTERDFSVRLPIGQHTVELEVLDPLTKRTKAQAVTVEPDQLYPAKPLRVKYKGMRMTVGWKGMNHTPTDITDEKLDIIHNELGCNAVYIFGNTEFEDDLIEAGRLATQKGFDRIYVAPMYLDVPIDQTVENIGKFAKKVKSIRETSDKIVFMVGHEFSFDAYGIVPGETYPDRLRYSYDHPTEDWLPKVQSIIPDAFRRIIALCNENYGYHITYAATVWEAEDFVPWSDPIFESVGTDAYIFEPNGGTENWAIRHLTGLKRYGKPVNSTEWGCLTYKRASLEWGFTDSDLAKYPYDEDEQANYIQQYCNMLNRADISGAFYTQIDDERLRGYGLYKATNPPYFGPGSSRKKGFYMYKSYQRT